MSKKKKKKETKKETKRKKKKNKVIPLNLACSSEQEDWCEFLKC